MPSSVTVQDTPSMGEAMPVAARDDDHSCRPQEAGYIFQEEQWKQAQSKQKTVEAINRCAPVASRGSGAVLLPTELAVLDSILGDDIVIRLGGGFVLLTSVGSDAESMASWTGVHRAFRLEIFQTPGTPFISHTGL